MSNENDSLDPEKMMSARDFCKSRGMDSLEAKAFAASSNCPTRGIQLPPDVALEVMQKLIKFGLIVGPVNFFFCSPVEEDPRFEAIIKSTSSEVLRGEVNLTPNHGESSMETLTREVSKGFSGTPLLTSLKKKDTLQ